MTAHDIDCLHVYTKINYIQVHNVWDNTNKLTKQHEKVYLEHMKHYWFDKINVSKIKSTN